MKKWVEADEIFMKEKKQKDEEIKQKNKKQAEYLKRQIQEREEKASTMNQH